MNDMNSISYISELGDITLVAVQIMKYSLESV